MTWQEYFIRSRVDPSADERAGWSFLGWKIGKYYEGHVRTLEQDAVQANEERGVAVRDVFAEEKKLKQDAMRMITREKDDEVARMYWGDRTRVDTIVDQWARAGYDWSQVAPFRLPRQSDEWKWWNGQDEEGLVALALQNDQAPVLVGAGSNVLVVTDNDRLRRQLQQRLWGHIGIVNLRGLMDEAGGRGYFNIVNSADLDRLMQDQTSVGLLARFNHVIVGSTRDLDTPTRLAREWCRVSGWRSGLIDRVAEAWLGVSENEKLTLDLTSLQNYWIGME